MASAAPTRIVLAVLLSLAAALGTAATASAAPPAVVRSGSATTSSRTVVAECPLPVLSRGSTGSAVSRLQQLLHVSPDGDFGPVTQSAVRSAQASHQLATTGVVDADTWGALGGTCSHPGTTTRDRLDARIAAFVATRSSAVSVGVFDRRTGASYVSGSGANYDTASIVKVQVLGTLLSQAARQRRSLTAAEKALASRMIRSSDNAATTQLWNRIGGGGAVAGFERAVGMTRTSPGRGGYWGLTTTTASDQLLLLRNVAYQSKVLSAADRAYVRQLMGSVVAGQRWGVSGGVPAGVTVELKNGWLPRATHGWRVHSIGHVRGQGRDYVLVVLTQDNSTMASGVRTVEGLSAVVWQTLAAPLQPH